MLKGQMDNKQDMDLEEAVISHGFPITQTDHTNEVRHLFTQLIHVLFGGSCLN